jgi:hypothetical protein
MRLGFVTDVHWTTGVPGYLGWHDKLAADGGYAAVVGPETAAWGDGPAREAHPLGGPAVERTPVFVGERETWRFDGLVWMSTR